MNNFPLTFKRKFPKKAEKRKKKRKLRGREAAEQRRIETVAIHFPLKPLFLATVFQEFLIK